MNEGSSLILNALALASEPDSATGPSALLSALDVEGIPRDFLARGEGTEQLTLALQTDFDFLQTLYSDRVEAGTGRLVKYGELLRWLILTAKNWRVSDDEKMRLLVAVLFTSKNCGMNQDLWQILSDDDAPSIEFLATLRILISTIRTNIDVRESTAIPLWEREFVEAFQAADANFDCAAIAEMWPRLEYAFNRDTLLMEMVRCLARYDFSALVQATDTLQQSAPIMQIAQSLDTDQRLQLASNCTTQRVRFCCVFVTINKYRIDSLSCQEENKLTEILVSVARRPAEWREWMRAFNTHPIRYPFLQIPLGKALAKISENCVIKYLESINLYSTPIAMLNEDRTLVNKCLDSFRSSASLDFRKKIWTRAHNIWRDWNFKDVERAGTFSGIEKSNIDFAIVCYAIECLSDEDRKKTIIEIVRKISNIDLIWHASESGFIMEVNYLLSLLQPYYHARNVINDGANIIDESKSYYPAQISESLYFRIMFRIS